MIIVIEDELLLWEGLLCAMSGGSAGGPVGAAVTAGAADRTGAGVSSTNPPETDAVTGAGAYMGSIGCCSAIVVAGKVRVRIASTAVTVTWESHNREGSAPLGAS